MLQYGADGTYIRKVGLDGVTAGVEVFTPFAGSTYLFLDTIQDFPFAALYFIDVVDGSLDTNYGVAPEEPTPGGAVRRCRNN